MYIIYTNIFLFELMKNINLIVLSSLFIVSSCGGGGGGGGSSAPPAPTPTPTVSISASSSNGYQYEATTITWSSTNASSCSASNAWSGTKATSGSESFTFDTEGSFTFELTCSGSGGNGSGSVSVQAFIYEKVVTEVTDYTWDGFALGQIIDWYNYGCYENVCSDTWFYAYDDIGWNNATALDTTVVEPGASTLNISYSGNTRNENNLNLSLNFNGWNTDEILLYEYGKDDPSYGLINAIFSDLNVSVFTGYPDYMTEKGIEYAVAAQLIGETPNGLRNYLFPTFYGDYTETSDLPSGQSTLSFETIQYYHEENHTSSEYETFNTSTAASGTGSLDFDFDAGTVSGDFTLNNWMQLDEFLAGNGPNAQITSIGSITVSIINGQISGNRFYASISYVDESSGSEIVGYADGALFGPGGKEIGISMIYFTSYDSTDPNSFGFGAGIAFGELP